MTELHPDEFPRCPEHNVALTLSAGWWRDSKDPTRSRLQVPAWKCPRGHEVHGWVLTPYAELAAVRRAKTRAS